MGWFPPKMDFNTIRNIYVLLSVVGGMGWVGVRFVVRLGGAFGRAFEGRGFWSGSTPK